MVQIVKYTGRVLQPEAALWIPCIEVDADYGIVLPAVSLAVREFFQAKLFDLLSGGRRDLFAVLLSDRPGNGTIEIVGPDLLQNFVPRLNVLDLGQPVKIRERNLPAGNLFQLVLVQLHHFYAATHSRL